MDYLNHLDIYPLLQAMHFGPPQHVFIVPVGLDGTLGRLGTFAGFVAVLAAPSAKRTAIWASA